MWGFWHSSRWEDAPPPQNPASAQITGQVSWGKGCPWQPDITDAKDFSILFIVCKCHRGGYLQNGNKSLHIFKSAGSNFITEVLHFHYREMGKNLVTMLQDAWLSIKDMLSTKPISLTYWRTTIPCIKYQIKHYVQIGYLSLKRGMLNTK